MHYLTRYGYFTLIILLFFLSCGSEQKMTAATPEEPFRGESVSEEITVKGYTLKYKRPKDFVLKVTTDLRREYEFDGCEFVVMLILYEKSIPRWAYYQERIDYQNQRVKKKISETLSGNSTLGGLQFTYYFLKEIRIEKNTGEKKYLMFFERYNDMIQGPNNPLIKMVLRTSTPELLNKHINTAAFIFRTYEESYTQPTAE